MSVKNISKNILNDAIIKDIYEAVNALEYGEVVIKVHGSRIIQVKVTEKKRFDAAWRLEGGGGI